MLEHDEAQISRLLFGIEENGRVEPGLLEQAHGGTLYLDDVCCFPASVQQELLKVILDQSVTRITAARRRNDCVLFHPAMPTRKQALKMAPCGRLYHRLNVVTWKCRVCRKGAMTFLSLSFHHFRR